MRLAPLAPFLAAALALPACASTPGQNKKEEWYSGDPSGVMKYDREGPYIGLEGIQGHEAFDLSGTGLTSEDSDVGIGIRGGLRLDPALAVEISVESVTGYKLSSGPVETDLDFLNFVLAGKFYFSPTRIQPYAIAGIGFTEADVHDLDLDEDGTVARIGGGVDIYVTPAVAVFAEGTYNRGFSGLNDLDSYNVMLGLLFRF